jgi:hypothetical protein
MSDGQVKEIPAQPIDSRLSELVQKERDLTAKLKDSVSWDQVKELASKDRSGFLKRLGLEAKHFQEDDSDPIVAMRNEINTLKKQREEEDTARREADSRRAFREKLGSDKHEVIKALDLYDEVYSLRQQHTSQGQEVPDEVAFADQYEDALLERLKPAFSSKKFASLLGPSKDPSEVKSNPVGSQSTLTGSEVGHGRTDGGNIEDPEARKRRAAQLLTWK